MNALVVLDEHCEPDWYDSGNGTCPYGYKSPHFEVTVPHDLDAVKAIAVFYSCVPYFFAVALIAAWVWTRSTKATSWIFIATLVPAVTGVFSSMLTKQRRPRSCLTTCGLPPVHTCFNFAILFVLLWDDVVQRNDKPRWRLFRALAYIGLLSPHAWARVELGDASVYQAQVGIITGMLFAMVWVCCLSRAVDRFVQHWIYGLPTEADRKRQDAISNVELTSVQVKADGRVILTAPHLVDDENRERSFTDNTDLTDSEIDSYDGGVSPRTAQEIEDRRRNQLEALQRVSLSLASA